jgi:hypothetical protein
LSALEKQGAWLQSIMQRAIVAVAGSEAESSGESYTQVDETQREEVANALRLSGVTAQGRIDVARTLTQHLPQTCEALASGEISPAQATVIARESAEAIKRGLVDHEIYLLEKGAIAHSEFHTPAQVAAKIRTMVAKIAPQSFEEAAAEARVQRSVCIYPQAAGMAQLIALLPAVEAQTVMLAIDKIARRMQEKQKASQREGGRPSASSRDFETAGAWHGEAGVAGTAHGEAGVAGTAHGEAGVAGTAHGEAGVAGTAHNNQGHKAEPLRDRSEGQQTLEQLRADALASLASNYLEANIDEAPSHRRPTTINLTIDLPTLLGLAENPGILSGYGAIPPSIARELAVDGSWRRFITDPISGALLDCGREKYQPPQALVDFIMARDQTCRFPGCRQPGRVSDIDHAEPWESGGETTRENMGLLCRRHHLLKTHGGWELVSNSDGSCEWTSPAGLKYFIEPRPVHEVA